MRHAVSAGVSSKGLHMRIRRICEIGSGEATKSIVWLRVGPFVGFMLSIDEKSVHAVGSPTAKQINPSLDKNAYVSVEKM